MKRWSDRHRFRPLDACLWAAAASGVAALLLSCSPDRSASAEEASLIEVRLAQDMPRTDWSPENHDGQVLCVAPDIVLSDSDLVSVVTAAGNYRLVLDVSA